MSNGRGALDGKTCIITGGAGSVGLATARLFIAEGANIMLVDSNEAALQTATDGLASDRGESRPPEEQTAPEEQALLPSGGQAEEVEAPAAAATPEKVEETAVELLTFSLTEEIFSFRIQEIQEIIKPPKMTAIPRTGPHVIGITSLRGKIIPVIDLKKRLSLSGEHDERKQKILVLKGPQGPIGALVDGVIGVIRPLASEIGETPPHLRETETRFIDGVVLVGGKFVSIVKADEALVI